MAIVDTLDQITEWVQENICTKIKLKVPPDDKAPMDGSYNYTEANPVAFTNYVPAKDRLPPDTISNMPSICVRMAEGQDNTIQGKREMTINLGLSCWNPGLHKGDVIHATDSQKDYRRESNGWKDAMNLTEIVLREIESVSNINGIQVISDRVKFGPFKDQESIPDYYPFWFAFVEFTVVTGIIRNKQNFEEFL
ncbi:MAG: hypothetical protein PHX08_11655 [Lachnospiraceae bacterium]|nr:hypothetical protein [Lachnospiraceae bacterium]